MTIQAALLRAVALAALVSSSASQAVTFYTDAVAFESAAVGATNSDFSSVGEAGTFVDTISFTVDGVNFQAVPSNFVIDGSIIPAYGGVFFYSSASPVTLISSLAGFSALGLVYGSTLDSAASLTFTLSDGSSFGSTFPSEAGTTSFFGFTSDSPISSVTVSNTGLTFDVISFSFVPAPAPAIPEPGTWATLILGLALVGGVMRRKRRMAGQPGLV